MDAALMPLLVVSLVLCLLAAAPAASAARAFFVFGDSLVDNGNNNYLLTTARADAPPYGIDFPTHQATGRFSNGLNIPDIIIGDPCFAFPSGEHLGAEPALPYLSPELRGEKLLVGANFASAGVGILNDTGIQFVNIIRIGDQLQYFREYQRKLRALVGEPQATQLVNQALVLITLGGNDFVNNYYLVPMSVRSRQYALPDYVRFIVSEYRKILSRLYELGARRVIVTGTGPLGCVPAELALHSQNGECAAELTRAVNLFNPQMVDMVRGLNRAIGADVFVTANTYRMNFDYLANPQDFGFTNVQVACCGQGPYNGIGLCTAASNVCDNRDVFAFWDAFHPTERANRIIVAQFMHGDTDYMHPMNLSTILAMDQEGL
uniref:GDSL esterase/lipase LTL1 n=1 Tax=Zea mays TaxID=4577 RepID=A0A804NTE5_MAIZE